MQPEHFPPPYGTEPTAMLPGGPPDASVDQYADDFADDGFDFGGEMVDLEAIRRAERRRAMFLGAGLALVAAAVVGIAVVATRGGDGETASPSPATSPVTTVAPLVATTQPLPTLAPLPTLPPTTAAPVTLPPTTAAPATTSTLAPTTTVVLPQPPPRAVVVRGSDRLPLLGERVIARLGVPDRGQSTDGTDSASTIAFSPTGDGNAVVVNPRSGGVVRVLPDGTTWRNTIPTDDVTGRPWAAAIGPDDRLYVSQTTDISSFTLVAYNLPDSGPAIEAGWWPTNWECVEGTCGEIRFGPDGIDVGTEVVPYDRLAPSRSPLVGAVEWEFTGGVDAGQDCRADSDGLPGGFNEYVRFADHAWNLTAACTTLAEGSFGSYFAQTDGSVLARVTVSDDRNDFTPVLVHLRTDGTGEAYALPREIWNFALVKGKILAITPDDSGELRLVELVKG